MGSVGAEKRMSRWPLCWSAWLFAQSAKRARYGACLSPGFRAVPLVHIASPSPSMRIALRRNLVPAEPVRSGRDWPIVVLAAFGRERIDDPRQLVGERHRGQLELVLDGLALEHSARPAARGVVMPFCRSAPIPASRK